MKSKAYYDPWPHLITDDALNAMEWNQLQGYLSSIRPVVVSPNEDHNVKRLVGTESDPKDKQIHTMLSNITMGLFKQWYGNLTYNRIEEELVCSLEFRYIGPGFRYNKIHTDIPIKRMSNVLFVSPEITHDTLGTQLYTGPTPDTYHSQIQWKPNRILSFVGDQDRTWHDFGNDTQYTRVTINMTLGYPRDLL